MNPWRGWRDRLDEGASRSFYRGQPVIPPVLGPRSMDHPGEKVQAIPATFTSGPPAGQLRVERYLPAITDDTAMEHLVSLSISFDDIRVQASFQQGHGGLPYG